MPSFSILCFRHQSRRLNPETPGKSYDVIYGDVPLPTLYRSNVSPV